MSDQNVEDELASDGSDVLPGTKPPTEKAIKVANNIEEDSLQKLIDKHIEEADEWKKSKEGKEWMEEQRGE